MSGRGCLLDLSDIVGGEVKHLENARCGKDFREVGRRDGRSPNQERSSGFRIELTEEEPVLLPVETTGSATSWAVTRHCER